VQARKPGLCCRVTIWQTGCSWRNQWKKYGMENTVHERPQVNMQALMYALPVSALEPNVIASIGGFVGTRPGYCLHEGIHFLEPPAGRHEPYVDPAEALEQILRYQGTGPEDARLHVLQAVTQMKRDIAEDRWVSFFDSLHPQSPGCLPVSDFLAWLCNGYGRAMWTECRANVPVREPHQAGAVPAMVSRHIIDFLEQAADVTTATPMFRSPDNWRDAWPLSALPSVPPPRAMIEFMPGPPWDDSDCQGESWRDANSPFMRWRESMRPVAQQLEQVLGGSVYHFADLDCETDDDAVHRFLVLHWCCSWKPESAFVRYLLKVSGAKDVDALSAALTDPASYVQPFTMTDAFIGLEAKPRCHFNYLPPDRQKTVAVVFSTAQARDTAQLLLAQKIGVQAVIVAPQELATEDWVKTATRYCRGSTAYHPAGSPGDRQVQILALADELCVIANGETLHRGTDLKLSEWAEELLWLAVELGLNASYFGVDRIRLANPETCLKERGVPARVTGQKMKRAHFTRQLRGVRLENNFQGSGLWDVQGGMISHDSLDLPFPLLRRIARWQRDYDDGFSHITILTDTWWEQHRREEFAIARELQTVLGDKIAVALRRDGLWRSIDEIDGPEESAV
jgi:hypothetical protein